MTIQLCTTHLSWKEWEIEHPDLSFLQSWEWGELQRGVGHEPIRWQLFDQGKRVAQIQGFLHHIIPGVAYLYLPRMYSLQVDLAAMRQAAKNQKIDFLRIEPVLPLATDGLKTVSTHMRQPGQTLILDMFKSETELLAEMHTKTRYNIRVAEKHGIDIDATKNADIFWELNKETVARDGFKSHEKKYYEQMIALKMARQYTAYLHGTPLASIICIGFGETFTYLHGASSGVMRNAMAPYLLQWTAIQDAKQQGYHYYDFWGIAPLETDGAGEHVQCINGRCWNQHHSWSGITRFKVGFGGEYRTYPEAMEIICNRPAYFLLQNIKKIQSQLKRLKKK